MNIAKQTILLFDMDGTVIDSNKANFLAYQRAILEITKQDISNLYSEYTLQRFDRKILLSKFDFKDVENEQIIQLKENYFELFLKDTALCPKILAIIKNYKLNKKVLTTNANKKRALQLIDFHNLNNYFSNYFFNTKGNKFQNTITKFKLQKDLVLAFDNDFEEVEKARSFNINCIQV